MTNIHADATFKAVPSMFYQLLCIHGIILDTVVPCIYVLMTSKSRLLYDSVFLRIRELIPGFKPLAAVTDFEKALFSSIEYIFSADIQGCYFHYRQKLWKKWMKLGLSTIKDKNVISWLKTIISIPMLPEDAMEDAFYDLIDLLF